MVFPYTQPRNTKPASVSTRTDSYQILSPEGAYVYQISPMQQLERFLILGNCPKTKETVAISSIVTELKRALNNYPKDCIDLVVDVSVGGKAPKNDQAIFILALASSLDTTKNYALTKLEDVCRTGTHIFQFLEYVKLFRKLGRSIKTAVSRWYINKSADDLAFQVTKYKQREGWSHKKVLSLIHPKTNEDSKNAVLRYVANDYSTKDLKSHRSVTRINKAGKFTNHYGPVISYPKLLDVLEDVKVCDNEVKLAKLITEYKLAREHIPTTFLNSKYVWQSLLPHMPLTALIRNLGKLSSMNMFDSVLGIELKQTVVKLTDPVTLKKSKLHPMSIYLAMAQYSKGHGDKGSLTWKVNSKVMEALETAFFMSFNYIEPSNKNFHIGLDVSGSMQSKILDMNITSQEAITVMSMALLKSEPWVKVGMFTSKYKDCPIDKGMSLKECLRYTNDSDFGSTNVSSVIEDSYNKKEQVDVFTIMTDNDVNTGHNVQDVLLKYRKKFNPKAKLLVFSTIAHDRTVVNPKDPYQLDITGMNSDIPAIMSWFANLE